MSARRVRAVQRGEGWALSHGALQVGLRHLDFILFYFKSREAIGLGGINVRNFLVLPPEDLIQ